MKISLKDLKKAIVWIEGNTNAEWIHINADMYKVQLNTVDKSGINVEIEIFVDSNLMPKIRKTEIL